MLQPPAISARILLGSLLGALALWLALRGTGYTALWLSVAAAHPA